MRGASQVVIWGKSVRDRVTSSSYILISSLTLYVHQNQKISFTLKLPCLFCFSCRWFFICQQTFHTNWIGWWISTSQLATESISPAHGWGVAAGRGLQLAADTVQATVQHAPLLSPEPAQLQRELLIHAWGPERTWESSS